MKYFLSLFLLIPCISHAQQGIQNVHEVALSTNSITQTITVCGSVGNNTGAVDVANVTSSGTLNGYFGIEAYNPAASTNTINCGFDLMLSTISTNVWYGREIPAGIGVYFGVLSPRKLYCRTQNALGCTYLTITQLK